MSNNNMQQTTFWKFLQSHKIEIPIIQRDYAQGRIGNEKLRKKFLFDLKNALDGKFANNEKTLKLDFVYGSVENNRLNPLDGQQRLTTLWLLHWYIALKAGILSANKDFFKNFSYETRTSSREFCNKLCEFNSHSDIQIVEHIQKQTWFFSAWKQDPTIQAMLNMLGGTPIKDSKNIDIFDGIEEVFSDCDEENYLSYWNKLTNESPIIFYYLDLDGLSLSDDLYIKMNARGKALTSFENFKADLVGNIKKNKWEINTPPHKTMAHKLDTTWTDIFWKSKSHEHKIDEIYFTFLKRYFVNCIITATKKNEKASQKNYYLLTAEKIELSESFKRIWNLKYEYTNFDVFNPIEGGEKIFNYDVFTRLIHTFDNFHEAFKNKTKEEINQLFCPLWESNSSFYFIPEYIENPNAKVENNEPKYIPTTLTQSQRVIFFAVCSYFENNQYNEKTFKQWLRVVWNIVENANINSIQSMIGTMRLIDELKSSSNEIYNYLADSAKVINSDNAKEQVAEEIEKAIQIVNDTTNSWEKKIIEAERTAFFKGAIRFLFKTETNTIDWTKFSDRYIKSKLYFDINGVDADYKKDALLLRVLISFFTDWGQFWGVVYDNNQASWKYLLTDTKWIKPISKLLDENISTILDSKLVSNNTFNDMQKNVHEDLVYSTLLSNIVEGCKLNWRYDKYALYPPNANANWKKYVIGDLRNKIFFDLRENGIISTDQNIAGLPFFWGWELYFTTKINNKKYQWWNILKEQTDTGEWQVVENVNLINFEKYLINH